MSAMQPGRIAELLKPFAQQPLDHVQLLALATYLDLLMRWNQRINLTAVRSPEGVVTRHFGESIFAAEVLLPRDDAVEVCDVGSGAGFPGLPLKILRPKARVTLLEAHGKKATFLKEVVRATKLSGLEVVARRAEDLNREFDMVTLRAVERFAGVLPIAANLVRARGCLGLLIGSAQVEEAKGGLKNFHWVEPHPIPQSNSRVVLVGSKLG